MGEEPSEVRITDIFKEVFYKKKTNGRIAVKKGKSGMLRKEAKMEHNGKTVGV